MQSYRELGDALDRAEAASRNAKEWLARTGKDGLSKLLKIEIANSTWADGTLQLEEYLRQEIVAQLPQLAVAAVSRMDERAVQARRDMAAVFSSMGEKSGEAEGSREKPEDAGRAEEQVEAARKESGVAPDPAATGASRQRSASR